MASSWQASARQSCSCVPHGSALAGWPRSCSPPQRWLQNNLSRPFAQIQAVLGMPLQTAKGTIPQTTQARTWVAVYRMSISPIKKADPTSVYSLAWSSAAPQAVRPLFSAKRDLVNSADSDGAIGNAGDNHFAESMQPEINCHCLELALLLTRRRQGTQVAARSGGSNEGHLPGRSARERGITGPDAFDRLPVGKCVHSPDFRRRCRRPNCGATGHPCWKRRAPNGLFRADPLNAAVGRANRRSSRWAAGVFRSRSLVGHNCKASQRRSASPCGGQPTRGAEVDRYGDHRTRRHFRPSRAGGR